MFIRAENYCKIKSNMGNGNEQYKCLLFKFVESLQVDVITFYFYI